MTGSKPCAVCKLVGVVVGLGALNWGLVGLFQVDLVARLLGEMTGPARAVYTIIGIAGILAFLALFGCCPCSRKTCEPSK